jgi:outer membrane receptor protein involved in Fe transport
MNADVRLGQRVVARVFADRSTREIEKYFFSGATQLASTVYDSQRTQTRQSVSPQVDVQVSPSTFLTGSYTYGKYIRDETRIFVVGGRVVPQAPWREWNRELKVSARHDWSAFGRLHPLQVGVERRDEKLRRATLSVTDPERDVNVGWFQQEVSVTNALRLSFGARYDDYSDFGSQWSPKANAVLALGERHRLRASFGHGFRPPYFNELYLLTPPSFVGNPALTPESSDTLSGGYTYSSSRVQFAADAYRAEVHDGIVFDLRALPFTYGNLREYTSRGANVSASVSLPGGFTPSVSYSYNRREDSAGVEIGGYENHSAAVKLLWTSPKLGLRANVRAVARRRRPRRPTARSGRDTVMFYAQVSKQFKTRRGTRSTSTCRPTTSSTRATSSCAAPTGTEVAGDFRSGWRRAPSGGCDDGRQLVPLMVSREADAACGCVASWRAGDRPRRPEQLERQRRDQRGNQAPSSRRSGSMATEESRQQGLASGVRGIGNHRQAPADERPR